VTPELFTADTDSNLHGNINTAFSDFINGSNWIRWMVTHEDTSDLMRVDYFRMNVTYTQTKGKISTTVGDTPFYTTDSNPQNATDTACLATMIAGNSCQVTWQVNATGKVNVTWEFFAYANSTDATGVGSDDTPHINITIIDNIAPHVASIFITPPLPVASQNLTCNIIVNDPNSQDSLTINLTWFRNNVFYLSTQENVTRGVQSRFILGFGNTTVGETWICGATPSDQMLVGPQVNSSGVTILDALPPSINQIQCQENNTVWAACSNLIFGDTFSGVRANCT